MTTYTSAQLADATRGQTVSRLFRDTVRSRPDAVALRWQTPDGGWGEMTWVEYAERALRVAAALRRGGLDRGQRVVLMMRNRPEFHIADLGVLLAGGTPISIYSSNAPEQVQYIVENSGAVFGIVEDQGYLDRFVEVWPKLETMQGLAVVERYGGEVPAGVVSFDNLLAADPDELDEAAERVAPRDLATVIYTSGTTGPPKGVTLDHANIAWTIKSLYLAFCEDGEEWIPEGRRLVSYLPMAHIAERMTSHYMGVAFGYELTTCPNPSEVVSYLAQVRPELFFAVPRIWEKAYGTIHAIATGDADKAPAFEAALELGWQISEYRARGEDPPAELVARWEQADAEQLEPWRTMIGLDQCLVAITAAAPIPYEILRFMRGLGVPLSELYGLSETSGPMTWSRTRVKVGTVGPPLPGVEVRLADDGEVCCRGGNVFGGYLNQPEKTAEVLDDDGWFHSGDIGVFDPDGYLKIVDRKKELIITAGGKNISPANLEAALKAHPLIGQACAVGDGKPFIAALIVLDPEVAPAWAKLEGIADTSLTALAENPVVIAEVQKGVDEANKRFSNVEQVKKFKILTDEWMPDSQELTPTMKLKRRGIHAKYAVQIEELYG